MYEYITSVLISLAIWVALFLCRKDLRTKMIFSSMLCTPIGLTEPLFVPNYWNPNAVLGFSLLGMSFDVESLIFSFVIGGWASVLYEEALNKHLRKARETRQESKRHFIMVLIVVLVSTGAFSLYFGNNVIYSGTIAMAIGAAAIVIMRKDLARETIYGGLLFLMTYSLWLFVINTFFFPNWVEQAWNLDNLSGILLLGIPLEESLFALAFGSLWAPIYETAKGQAVS